ncbi:BTB/POZ/MATH-domain protein [Rhynchospora pubera]|uniref:BTB/POZ/MATH-domain protein n=2 Tax=Rhynchospora pubera TaxID=906938 RepID=A0AAV8DXL5_9POAL|nr:BTB/POZ/MATH-domain protein [Rhynchospora pubera]
MASTVTASTVEAEVESGSHLFTILRYSLIKGLGIGKSVTSDVFTIGGFDWIIRFHPDGSIPEATDFISFFLELKSSGDVNALFELTILEHNGLPSNMRFSTPQAETFNITKIYYSWGLSKFAKRSEFEASNCLKNDAFTIKCTVTVLKGSRLRPTTPYGITVPPSNSNQQFARLLESEIGADVTFVVKGEKIRAHRCVLAAKSAVFNAELFGSMREKWTEAITVDDIEAPVFKFMLYFIYSDSLLDFEQNSNNDGEHKDLIFMAQHLLVAADRYDLERLKLMCEDLLYKNLDVSTVASTFVLAEQHSCKQLKAQCVQFMSSREVLKMVAETDAFHIIMKNSPSILKDV